MKIWLDAQLPPGAALWMRESLGVDATHVREIGLLHATDAQIFEAARQAAAVVMTKDGDFVELLGRLGPPPQVLWLTCGNTSNARLRTLLARCWPQASALLAAGERLVEIGDVGSAPTDKGSEGR